MALLLPKLGSQLQQMHFAPQAYTEVACLIAYTVHAHLNVLMLVWVKFALIH